MEEEINNIEETKEPTTKQRESRNLFKYDYPAGRLTFIVSTILILIISFVVVVLSIELIYPALSTNDQFPYLMAIMILLAIFLGYLGVINFAKRFYDLFADKQKGLFYAIFLYIINLACSNIPAMRYLFLAFSFTVTLILLLKQGKLVK